MASGSLPTASQPGSLAATTVNEGRSRPPLLSLFFAFQIIGGHIGFPILLAVIFALRNASSRHPLFINFCVIWIISSVVFCILLYAGYDTGPEPPFSICSVQASLVYAMPIMSAVSLWALVFHLWLCLRNAMTQAQITRSRERQYLLIGLPYIVAIPFVIFPAVVASEQPDRISRAQTGFGFHCSTDFQPLRTTVSIFTALALLMLLVWEFMVGWICYKNWKAVRKIRVYGWASVNLFTRIAIFTLYVALGIVACVIAIAFPSNRFRILFQASLPTAAFLFFGTRPDLWKRAPSSRISTTATNSRSRSGSGSANSKGVLSNSFSGVHNHSRTRSSSQNHLTSFGSTSLASKARSFSIDSEATRTHFQPDRASTIASPLPRSKSLQSIMSKTEKEFDVSERVLPPLPRKQILPLDVGPEGTIHDPEESLTMVPRRGAIAWEDARGGEDPRLLTEKIIKEPDDHVLDIRRDDRPPERSSHDADPEKGLPR